MTAADAVVVFCTAPAAATEGQPGGHEIARQLVEDRLCACVKVMPKVQSYYRWEGRIESAEELLLIAKTTPSAIPRLRQRLVELHPYDVPELVELPVAGGLPAYLAWIVDSVEP